MSCGPGVSEVEEGECAQKIRRNAEQRRGKKRSTGESDRKKVMRETRARFVKDYVLFIEGAFFSFALDLIGRVLAP